MKGLKNNSAGFSLIELLIGIFILSIIGASGIFTVQSLHRQNEVTINNMTAVNCLQFSAEELRRITKLKFDDFGSPNCDYSAGNICGFLDSNQMGDNCFNFTRTIAFDTPSNDYKQAIITVNWTENGQPKHRTSTFMISQPPEQLPGNIRGLVTDGTTGLKIPGASVTAVHLVTGKSVNILSDSDPDGNGVNYDFKDGYMEIGDWQLTATAAGFNAYTHPSLATVVSQSPTIVNFAMVRTYANATIRLHFKNGVAAVALGNNLNTRIGMYQGNVLQGSLKTIADSIEGGLTYVFSVPFDLSYSGSPEEYVTFATKDLWYAGYVGRIGGTFGYTNCQTKYHRDGISTAVMSTSDCNTPWNGGPDTVLVTPGQVLDYDVDVSPLPLATLQGNITWASSYTAPDISVSSTWYNNIPYDTTTVPINTPSYSVSMPATQDFFLATDSNYFNKVRYNFICNYLGCCDVPSGGVSSNGTSLFAAHEGASINYNLNMSCGGSQACGNLEYTVIDFKTGLPMANVSSTLNAATAISDGSGHVLYQCSAGPPPYASNGGYLRLTANNYYTYNYPTGWQPNYFYSGLDPNGVSYQLWIPVSPNILNTYTPPGGVHQGLWPQGFGNLTVTVREKISHSPTPGVTVRLIGPHLGTFNPPPASPSSTNPVYNPNLQTVIRVTDSMGQAHFNNILETWPPLAAAGNQAIKPDIRNYTAYVDTLTENLNIPVNYLTPVPPLVDITVNSGESKEVFLEIEPRGGI